MNEKIFGALFGVAVGDALGAPLEFMSEGQIKSKHGLVTEMIGGGWLNLSPGEITDDTQMTIAVAKGILEDPANPIPYVGREFIKWHDGNPKDIGNCCRAVISRAKSNGEKWEDAAVFVHETTGGKTAGNGALMRTMFPILYYGNESKRMTDEIGRMTHLHKHSRVCLAAYHDIIRHILNGGSKEGISQYIIGLPPSDLKPDGYAPNSIKIAVKAVLDCSSYEDTLVSVVNMGGDSDTNGAIAGGIAGALYGVKAIPSRWVEALDGEIRRTLTRLADTVYDAVSERGLLNG